MVNRYSDGYMIKESMIFGMPDDDGDVTIGVEAVYDKEVAKDKFGEINELICVTGEFISVDEIFWNILEFFFFLFDKEGILKKPGINIVKKGETRDNK